MENGNQDEEKKTGNLGKEKSGKWDFMKKGYRKNGYWEKELSIEIYNGKKRNQQGWKFRKIEICKKGILEK